MLRRRSLPFARTASRGTGLVLALAMLLACAGRPPAPPDGNRASAASPPRLTMSVQPSGSSALLQAISAVDERVVWVSGHRGTVLRTLDGGANWTSLRVPDADSLQFRDVHAADANRAWVMSAGTGAVSRIYNTADGGATWTLQHTNPDGAGFYDCLAFWDASAGFLYGDEVDGRLVVRTTADGGATWTRVPRAALPAAQPGEGGFAASGTCALTVGERAGWIATGNAARSRVLRTTDRGATWQVADAPVPAGAGAGLAAIAMHTARTGLAFGGNIGDPAAPPAVGARTTDGGASWTPTAPPPLSGAVYGAAAIPASGGVVAVNPHGLAVSWDHGATWTMADTSAMWAVGFASPRVGWAVGPRGRIVRLEVAR